MTENSINTFLNKVSSQFNIDINQLQDLWKTHNLENKDDEEGKNNEIEDLSRCNVVELKSLCKKRGFKVSGKKIDLLNRLLGKEEKPSIVNSKSPIVKKITKKEETKRTIEKHEKIEEKSKILNILKNERPNINISRNAFHNLEHKETGFLFNTDKIVIGKQNENGNIDLITEKDIDTLNKWNFKYDTEKISIYKQKNENDSESESDLDSDEYKTEEELEDDDEEE